MELPHECITDLSKDGFVSIVLSPLSIRSKRPPQMLKQPNNGIILARTNLRPQSMTQIESKQKRLIRPKATFQEVENGRNSYFSPILK